VQVQKGGHINDMDNYFNFLRCILCFLEDHPVFQKNPSGSGNVSLLYASFDAWAKANILEARTQAELALKQNLKAELALANERLIALMQEVILLESSPLNVANQEAFEKWQSAHQTLDAFQRDMASLFLFFEFFIFFEFLNFIVNTHRTSIWQCLKCLFMMGKRAVSLYKMWKGFVLIS